MPHTQYHTHTVNKNKASSKRVTKMWLTWFFKTKKYKKNKKVKNQHTNNPSMLLMGLP